MHVVIDQYSSGALCKEYMHVSLGIAASPVLMLFKLEPVQPSFWFTKLCGWQIIPGPHSDSKVVYLDPLEVGWAVWVNIGSCLSSFIALSVWGVGIPCNCSCFQTRGCIHPSHWLAPRHLSFLSRFTLMQNHGESCHLHAFETMLTHVSLQNYGTKVVYR